MYVYICMCVYIYTYISRGDGVLVLGDALSIYGSGCTKHVWKQSSLNLPRSRFSLSLSLYHVTHTHTHTHSLAHTHHKHMQELLGDALSMYESSGTKDLDPAIVHGT
jgi:hypothetical protein